jgi:hypothetical protein
MLLDWRPEWQRTFECPAAVLVRNVWTLIHRLTDNPSLSRLEACQLRDNTGVTAKLEHCEENVSVMFHAVRTPSNIYLQGGYFSPCFVCS